jgi:chemotaxis protein CheD
LVKAFIEKIVNSEKMDIGVPTLPGFDNIQRYWDKKNSIVAAKLLPGEYYVTTANEMLTTVLGSCISACIRETTLGIGGMNHFMLPQISDQRLNMEGEEVVSRAMRYGNYAMEHLINIILSRGGKRPNLEVKLFGGGKLMAILGSVGQLNVDFVLDYIEKESLTLVSSDLGDIYARKVNYFPQSGRVMMKKLRHLHNDTIIHRERHYQTQLKEMPIDGEIELF